MKNFNGVIIEESLENKDVLRKVKILKTDIEPVTEGHKTPWVKQWTLFFPAYQRMGEIITRFIRLPR